MKNPWGRIPAFTHDGRPYDIKDTLSDAGDSIRIAARDNLLESAFYRFAEQLERNPKAGGNYSTLVTLGVGDYTFGIGENGKPAMWDKDGKEEPALEALNRNYRTGVFSDDDMGMIRRKIGLDYFLNSNLSGLQ